MSAEKKAGDLARKGPPVKDRAKMEAFLASSPTSATLPGPYPDFLPSGNAKPAVTRDLVFEVYPFLQSTLQTLSALKRTRRWKKFWTQIVQSVDGMTAAEFDGTYMASAVLCLAQKIVASHVAVGRSQGDFSSLAAASLPVFAPVRKIAHQYGCFRDGNTGEILIPAEYDDLIRRLIHLADRINTNGINGNAFNLAYCQMVSQTFFLPVQAADEGVDATLRFLMNSHLNGLHLDSSVSVRTPLFSGGAVGNMPGWITAYDPQPAPGGGGLAPPTPLVRLFQGRPSIAAWAQAPMTAALSTIIPDYGGGAFPGVQGGDIEPGFWNHKPIPPQISNSWTRIYEAIKDDITVVNNIAIRSTTGVWSQLGRSIFDPEEAMITVRLPFGATAREAAMAMLYPAGVSRVPQARDFLSGLSADARLTAISNRDELRDAFVWSHIGSGYG